MDLNYSPEEESFRQEIGDFCRAELPPAIAAKVLGGQRLQALSAAPGDDHAMALGNITTGNGGAETGTGTGDQDEHVGVSENGV